MKKMNVSLFKIFLCSIHINLLFITCTLYAQWGRTSGPEGGYTYDFVSSGLYFYAGTMGGVFVTSDNGISWTPVNNGIIPYEIYAMTAAGQFVFAGTKHGVFRTSNNGQSWSQANNGFTAHRCIVYRRFI